MTTNLRRFAIAFAALLVLQLTYQPGADTPATSPDVLASCFEDEPCWDCSTMGNRVCGPVSERNTP